MHKVVVTCKTAVADKSVAQIGGGGGGGRPDMAQAGGKCPEKINEAIAESYKIVESLVK